MRVSQRVDYALRALVLLATGPEGEYVAAGDLADRLVLPRRFVEQQVSALARAGIVTSRRGPAGGFALARAATEIDVRSVVMALQGEVIDVPHQQHSATAELWQGLAQVAEEYLNSTSIATLVERQRQLDVSAAPMYYI